MERFGRLPIRRPPRDTFTLPRLIICEGPSDEAFFRALIAARPLPEFCIRHTGESNVEGSGGISRFGDLLKSIPSWNGFYQLTDIILVADNDLTPQENFDNVCEQISSVGPYGVPPQQYPVPSRPLKTIAGLHNITVLMVPSENEPGVLETLCLTAAVAAAPDITACTEKFANCTNADEWENPNNLTKMKLRSLLTAQSERNPLVGLGMVWNQNPGLIPLNHEVFDPIVDFLGGFHA